MKKVKASRLNNNRKGLSGPALIGTFILVFLMVFGLIALYQKVMKGGTKVLECKNNGGDCVKGTCDFVTQIPALSDKAAGCQSGELCCINITKDKPIDPLCKGLKFGDLCGDKKLQLCDAGLQCVSKCEFCAKNFDTTEVRKLCEISKDKINPFFEQNRKDSKTLTCGCTKVQCDAKNKEKAGTCATGFCPGSNYCCTTT